MTPPRRTALRALLALAGAALVAPRAARATTMHPVTLEALARQADEVVVATPRTERSYWVGRYIVTDYVLDVEAVSGGTLGPRQRVTLRLPGGVVGRIGQEIPGTPRVDLNTPYVFFLARAPGATGLYYLAHLTAGVLPITAAADGTATVHPAAEGLVVGAAGATSATTVMPAAGLTMESFVRTMAGLR